MKRGTQRALLATAAALVAILLAAWFLRADAPESDVLFDGTTMRASPTSVDLDSVERARDSTDDAHSARARAPLTRNDPTVGIGPTLVIAHVTSVETGAPVAHVRVSAWRDGGTALATPHWIVTDESGTAELEVQPSVELILRAQGDGRRTGATSLTISALSPGETREFGLTLRTQEDLELHGVVLRRDTREPIAGVLVFGEARRRDGPEPTTSTANDGTFRLAVRSFATLSLRYEHAEYGTAITMVAGLADAPPTSLEILLEPCAALRAHVVAADGSDTSDWSVVATAARAQIAQPSNVGAHQGSVADWSADVGSNGIASLERLPAHAPLALEVRRGSRTVWQTSGDLVLEPGELREMQIRVGGAAIVGFVREPSGEPASGVEIRAGPAGDQQTSFIPLPDRSARAQTTSATDGSYRLEGLAPGAWLVGPAPIPRTDWDLRRVPSPMAQRVVLESADVDARHDITLERGALIAGRVEHADGSPAPGARILAAFGPGDGRAESFAAEGGAFVVGPLAAGAWDLFAIDQDGASSPARRAEAGTEGLVLQIAISAHFTVRVTDEDAAPVANASVCVISADGKDDLITTVTDQRGIVELKQFSTGVFHVAATTSDARFASERDVVLTAGRAVDVELRLAPAGRARLRFDGPGETAFGFVFDRGLAVQSFSVTRGATVDLVGPIGQVSVMLIAGGSHEKSVELARGSGPELVFDGNWR